MSDYQLTVVVPIYNVEKYLRKCVDSILNQSFKVDEIILVDDGSLDHSGDIADEYASRYKQIKVIHQKNGGLSAARNAGIEVATREYIAFVDSDDYIDSVMYEELIKNLKNENADLSIGGVWTELENGKGYSLYTPNIKKTWNKVEGLIELNSFKYFNMSFCDAIFKRQLFEETAYGEGKLRFPVGKLCEDFYLMHRIIARTNKIVYTSTPFYHYVQRENSISRNVKINIAPMDASIKQLEFYNEWFPELAYIAKTAVFFAHVSMFTSYCRSGQDCPQKLIEEIDTVCFKYLLSVIKNQHIPKLKKIQAIIFCFSKTLYKAVVTRKSHR